LTVLLVVDANVFVGELLRRRGRVLMRNPRLALRVSERALEEARRELPRCIDLIVAQVATKESEANGYPDHGRRTPMLSLHKSKK
jgi:hypothetical protein